MSRLKVSDLSFCETAIHDLVEGGLFGNNLVSLLTYRSSEVFKQRLKKYFSEELLLDKQPSLNNESVVQSNNVTGNVSSLQATSEDGKSLLSVVVGQEENRSFTMISAISSTEKLPTTYNQFITVV